MKRGAPSHPKTYDLAERLGVRHVTAIGHLELLFHFTAQYAPEGDIGRYTDKRIASALEWAGKPADLIEALVTSGWCDASDAHRLVLHGWSEHADRSTLQRLARSGKIAIKSNDRVTGNLCTQSETKNRTSQSQSQSQSLAKPQMLASWPGTAAMLADEGAGENLAVSVITKAVEAWPTIADEELVGVLRAVRKPHQRSPGLYVKTVPEHLEKELKRARAAGYEI